MSWDDSANCRGLPADLFLVSCARGLPAPGVPSLCDDCPVRTPCLADGFHDEHSIRGGMIPKERKALGRYLVARTMMEATG